MLTALLHIGKPSYPLCTTDPDWVPNLFLPNSLGRLKKEVVERHNRRMKNNANKGLEHLVIYKRNSLIAVSFISIYTFQTTDYKKILTTVYPSTASSTVIMVDETKPDLLIHEIHASVSDCNNENAIACLDVASKKFNYWCS